MKPGSENDRSHARVVITGVGLASPFAASREATWAELTAGRSATRWIEHESPSGSIPDTDWHGLRAGAPANLSTSLPVPPAASPLAWEELDPVVALALTAAHEAVDDARISFDDSDRCRAGCVIGTSKGGLRSFVRTMHARTGDSASSARLWSQFLPSAPATFVSSVFGLRGAAMCPVSACATGLLSLVRGADLIRDGYCDVVVAGSTDASLQPALLASFHRMGVLARGFDDPQSACRPYDRRRNGFLVGEGAAVFVLERRDYALDRGAEPYAEWMSHGMAADVSGITSVDTGARSLTRLLRNVLADASLTSSEIDYVNLHGTATVPNDLCESRALRSVLGPEADRVSCSSVKGALGHMLGAAGSAETAATLLAMRDGIVPPTANLEEQDSALDLDYTPRTARPRRIENAVKVSLGFGGHLVAATLRRCPEKRPASSANPA